MRRPHRGTWRLPAELFLSPSTVALCARRMSRAVAGRTHLIPQQHLERVVAVPAGLLASSLDADLRRLPRALAGTTVSGRNVPVPLEQHQGQASHARKIFRRVADAHPRGIPGRSVGPIPSGRLPAVARHAAQAGNVPARRTRRKRIRCRLFSTDQCRRASTPITRAFLAGAAADVVSPLGGRLAVSLHAGLDREVLARGRLGDGRSPRAERLLELLEVGYSLDSGNPNMWPRGPWRTALVHCRVRAWFKTG